jgi:cold shock protein
VVGFFKGFSQGTYKAVQATGRDEVVSEIEASILKSGKVKWFSDQKGYGFIARDEASDVFVHHTAIEMDGFRTLRQGEDVEYQLKEGTKGPQAVMVKKAGAKE